LPLPLISVVIPVYNGEAFVADAIDSVLAQEGVAFELIVIDDGSTDTTPAILAGYGSAITVHRQPNRGEGAARNAALPHLRGELALFLDADDLVPPGYLKRFAAVAREAPEIDVFHCGWRVVRFDNGAPIDVVEEPRPIDVDPFHEVPVWGAPAIDAVLVRRSALTRLGGFDPALRVHVPWDFSLRLAASGARFRGVPGNVAIVRQRPDSQSSRRYRERGPVALAVLERHLRGHARCPACARVFAVWRRPMLNKEALRLASRIGLTGRPAKWIGTFLVVARQPRFIGAALDEFALAVSRQPRLIGARLTKLAAQRRLSLSERKWYQLLRATPIVGARGIGIRLLERSNHRSVMSIKAKFRNSMPLLYSRLALINHFLDHISNRGFDSRDSYFWQMMFKKSRGTHNVECPLCGFIGRFKAWGSPPNWNVRCPNCESRQRHRQLGLVLKDMPLSGTLLHFAPEECVAAFLKTQPIQYVSADLFAPNVDLQLNIEKINLPDEQYDTIICSHVLVEVNDRVALLELHRVLKRDGTLFVMVPVVEGCCTTYEDETINSPEEREIHFGYPGNVRVYGADFIQRVRNAGFDVQVHVAFGKEAVRYGLAMGEKIFICRKTLA
jgi:glycosyltransferase involved in cell wall biosynthesis